jgi:actin-like ATPase involved in cell morphogenesis
LSRSDPWTLAIDFGTTYTCASISTEGDAQIVLLDGEQRMPSAVLLDPNEGLVTGKLAEIQGTNAPERLERNPKRRLGDGIVLLGGEPVQVIRVVAAVFTAVAAEATRVRGSRPAELRLTHPARWAVDGVLVRTLAEAAVQARLPEPSFVSEPVAAARFFGTGVPAGAELAVYDLGGGTFDTAVLRRQETGFELVGRPGGFPDLGGEDFDEAVFRFLTSQLPDEERAQLAGNEEAARRLRIELRRQARDAKEALSTRQEWVIPAPAPLRSSLRITRGELEELLRPKIEETLDELARTLEDAGTPVESLAGVYLAGGSSRVPLVQRLVAERFGGSVQMLDEPKTVVARGAALTAADEVGALATHGAVRDRPVQEAPSPPGKPGFWRRRSTRVVAGLLLLAVIAAGVGGYFATRKSNPSAVRLVSPKTLSSGDCFDNPEKDKSVVPSQVITFPCDLPHDYQVFGIVNHPAVAGAPFPGRKAIDSFSRAQCQGLLTTALRPPIAQTDVVMRFYPDSTGWAAGGREIVCAVGRGLHTKTTGSLLAG